MSNSISIITNIHMKSLLLFILLLFTLLYELDVLELLEDMYTSKSLILPLLLKLLNLSFESFELFELLKFSKNSFGMSFKFLLKFYSRPILYLL